MSWDIGSRVQMKEGWISDLDHDFPNRKGSVVGPTIDIGQLWTPILWDGEEDPDFTKAAGLEREFIPPPPDKAEAILGMVLEDYAAILKALETQGGPVVGVAQFHRFDLARTFLKKVTEQAK